MLSLNIIRAKHRDKLQALVLILLSRQKVFLFPFVEKLGTKQMKLNSVSCGHSRLTLYVCFALDVSFNKCNTLKESTNCKFMRSVTSSFRFRLFSDDQKMLITQVFLVVNSVANKKQYKQ